jgi:signal transduction histidine kinase
MTRVRPSVRLRLTAWYAGLFFAFGAVLLVVSYAVVRHNFDQAVNDRHVELESTLKAPKASARRIRVRIAPGLPEETAPQIARLSAGERAVYGKARAAIARADASANADAERRVLLEFLGALMALTLASIGAGWLIAGRALRPISRITATAQRISGRNLSERISLDGPRDELRELADTFDTMLCRLDAAFEAQKRFVANASHELRTPLAIVRTEIDVTLGDPDVDRADLREMAAVVRDANERMELLIDSLLALATSGAGAIERRPADLALITQGALERLRGAPAGLTIDAVLDAAPVTGDAVLLERVAANLVENAARYNEPGGWVRVRTRVTAASPPRAELVVANSGPHIPEGAVEELFEPFRRLDGSRSRRTGGYGLGLAVVRAVADAHGGETSAEALPDGGLAVRLALPADFGAAVLPVDEPAPARALPAPR